MITAGVQWNCRTPKWDSDVNINSPHFHRETASTRGLSIQRDSLQKMSTRVDDRGEKPEGSEGSWEIRDGGKLLRMEGQ